MPNLPSAFKRMKTSAVRRSSNRATKSTIATINTRLREAAEAGDKDKCRQVFREYCSSLDKAVKHGVIMQNTANRSKSRAAARIASLATAKKAD